MNGKRYIGAADLVQSAVMHAKDSSMGCRTITEQNDECPICHDTGWEFYKDEAGTERTRKCSCGLIDKRIMDRQRAYADIPEMFKRYTLQNFGTSVYKDREAIKKVSDTSVYWFRNLDSMLGDGVGLYISSHIKGSGKTRYAASVANELMNEYGYPVKFATSIQIINEIKATWNDNSTISESQLLNQLKTIKFLVLDDFGTETVKDWISERYYFIINERYVNNLPTIYTSNWHIDELKYDDRITNRILEKSIQINFPEESVRGMIAKQREMEMNNQRKEE